LEWNEFGRPYILTIDCGRPYILTIDCGRPYIWTIDFGVQLIKYGGKGKGIVDVEPCGEIISYKLNWYESGSPLRSDLNYP